MENTDIRIEKFNKFISESDYDFDFKKAYDKGYSTSKDKVNSMTQMWK